MNLGEAVKTIKSWTKKNASKLHAQIGRAATKSELKALDEDCAEHGLTPPSELIQFLKLMNGQKDGRAAKPLGLIPAIKGSFTLYSTDMLCHDIFVKYDLQQDIDNRGWFNFAGDGSRHLAIDLTSTTKGGRGQVILVEGKHPFRRVVIAKSLPDFIAKLAEAYRDDCYEWRGGLLRKTDASAFPDLQGTIFKTREGNRKKTSAKKSDAKSTTVEIKGRTNVVENHLDEDEKLVKKVSVLKALDELVSDESVLDTLDGTPDEISLREQLLDGGHIELSFDKSAKVLWVVTKYTAAKKLTKAELCLLVDCTTGQWSDGFGSSFSDMCESDTGYFVDLAPQNAPKPVIATNPKTKAR